MIGLERAAQAVDGDCVAQGAHKGSDYGAELPRLHGVKAEDLVLLAADLEGGAGAEAVVMALGSDPLDAVLDHARLGGGERAVNGALRGNDAQATDLLLRELLRNP
jgi:hypothetical protein